MKALKPPNQFESLVAHLATIIAFELVVLLSSSAGDASLREDIDVLKNTIVTTVLKTTTY